MGHKKQDINYQLMLDASPVALLLLNNAGEIIYQNKHAEKLLLYSKEEVLGKELSFLFPKKFWGNYGSFFEKQLAQADWGLEGENKVFFAKKKNGNMFPVELGINSIQDQNENYMLLALHDVSDSKNASALFELVFESAPNAIILVEGTGKIVMVNKQAESLFAYQRKELLGKPMEILVPDRFKKHHPDLRREYHHKPATRPMGAGRDLFALRKDGAEFPIEIGLNYIARDSEQYVLASIIDISERKKTEQLFKDYTRKIEHKNQELEQFTYMASHDLREPLNSIIALLSLVTEDDSNQLSESVRYQFNLIEKSAYRMLELITGLVDYALLGNNEERKEVDLNMTMEHVLNDLNSAINKSKAEITIEELPSVKVYDIEMRLLFQNLISNAIKYRRPGVSPQIKISSQKNGAYYLFSVSDNGIGIAQEQQDKIFLLFQRLHQRKDIDGIGIGLAHCKKIVELHDGRLWIESEQGVGSTFYFSLPIEVE